MFTFEGMKVSSMKSKKQLLKIILMGVIALIVSACATKSTVDRDEIRKVVHQNIRQIQICYERELQSNKDLSGEVVLTWVFGERGKVKSAGVKSTSLKNANVENCMVQSLKTWTFPTPPKGADVEVEAYPFLLQP